MRWSERQCRSVQPIMGATAKNAGVIFNTARGGGAGLVRYGDEDHKENKREPASQGAGGAARSGERLRAFGQGQEAVVPLPVHVSAKILSVGSVHDADIAWLAGHRDGEAAIVPVGPADELLARPFRVRIAQMGDALVR